MKTQQNYRKIQICLTKKQISKLWKGFLYLVSPYGRVCSVLRRLTNTHQLCFRCAAWRSSNGQLESQDRQSPTVIKWLTYDHALYHNVVSGTELNKTKKRLLFTSRGVEEGFTGWSLFFIVFKDAAERVEGHTLVISKTYQLFCCFRAKTHCTHIKWNLGVQHPNMNINIYSKHLESASVCSYYVVHRWCTNVQNK